MNTFNDIENIINSTIKENNNQEITAEKLKYVLLEMNNTFSDAIKGLNSTNVIQFKGTLENVDDLDSIINPTPGDTYLINKKLYTFIEDKWLQTGTISDVVNTINVIIPRTLENGQEFNNWQTDFKISDDDIEMIKSNTVAAVNITDNFNVLNDLKTPTYAVGTISYNEHGNSVAARNADLGQFTIAYSCDGTTIVYDIYIGFASTKVYINRLKSTSDIIYQTPIYITNGSTEESQLISDIIELQSQVNRNTNSITQLIETVSNLQTDNITNINNTINARMMTESEAESLFNKYFEY